MTAMMSPREPKVKATRAMMTKRRENEEVKQMQIARLIEC